jgi:hypothetical protein
VDSGGAVAVAVPVTFSVEGGGTIEGTVPSSNPVSSLVVITDDQGVARVSVNARTSCISYGDCQVNGVSGVHG